MPRKFKPPKLERIPLHRYKPKGTKEEMDLAYNRAREFTLKILDYTEKENLPDDVLEEQKRLLHFYLNGPRKGYFVAYNSSKLTQAEVLYILTVTTPKNYLAEKFNVSERLIQNIRHGLSPEWHDEYLLVKRLKTSIRGHLKSSGTHKIVYLVIDGKTNKTLAVLTSERKAKEYRKDILKLKAEEYRTKLKSGELDLLYPIQRMDLLT